MAQKGSGEVFVIVGDNGSALDLALAAKELEDRHIPVNWFADPKGKARTDVLEKKGISYATLSPGEYKGPKPSVILCGTSSGYAESQVAWTNFGKANEVPVLWYEDLWGTGEQANERGADPNVMLTVDELASQIVSNVRPHIGTIEVGKPSFGAIPPIEEIPLIRSRIRERLGVSQSDFLVSWGFQGEPNKMAVAHVGEIARTIPIDKDTIVAWRPHPKHLKKEELWEKLVSCPIKFVPNAREVDLIELYLSSNAVVVPFGGTDGYKAVLRGIPTITPLFPSGEFAKRMYDYDDEEARIASGFINGVPPLLIEDPNWGAENPSRVGRLLSKIRSDEIALRHYTLEHRSLPFKDLEKPGAAVRIADAVMKFL